MALDMPNERHLWLLRPCDVQRNGSTGMMPGPELLKIQGGYLYRLGRCALTKKRGRKNALCP